jgi:hypothetical protein
MNALVTLVVAIPLVLFNSPLSYILRSEIVYWAMLLVSLLFPWIAYEIIQNDLGKYDVFWFVTTVNMTTCLGLYKLFDQIILKLYNRHLFISWKGHYLHKNESWLDLIMQLILILLPAIWFWIGVAIFK